MWRDEDWYRSYFLDQPPAAFRTLVAEDEDKLFDRDQMYVYVVDERDTDLSQL